MSGPPGPPPGGPRMNGMRPPGPPPGAPGMSMGGYYPGPSAMPNFPPPLPAGWSEHTAPDGRTKYYYNSNTKESTYTRPSFAPLPNIVAGAGAGPNGAAGVAGGEVKEKKKKKEKPKQKVPIPDTTWTRVTTNEGNTFYFEKESKRSEWTVPDEIKDAVEALERSEAEAKEAEEREQRAKEDAERLQRLRERERIRVEIEEERKRKREAEAEADGGEGRETKSAKKTNGEQEEPAYEPTGEDDEAEWKKAVAAEFAEQDAATKVKEDEDKAKATKAEEEAAQKVFAAAPGGKVNVSVAEQRALFKGLLMEKDISPFAPFDASLPLFINDPRYILLGTMKDREEVFDEYCRDVGRQRRLGKNAAKSSAAAASEKPTKTDPERDYKALMREEVTSTRTRWDDFRKKWKKDRRFYAFGRDDREREKAFKTHLKELGERKRADAQRAEQDFFELLTEQPDISSSSVWADVKKAVASDPRYDAVGSSSLRQELFDTHIKKLASTSSVNETPEEAAARKAKERKAKEEASLRDRQARVQQEQEKVTQEANKSRAGAGREEGERLFGSLLVDQVRSHDVNWNDAVQYLQNDPRFNHPSLNPHDKRRMFDNHLAYLGSKRSNDLDQLFKTHATSLATTYDEIYPKIVEDFTVKRLGLQGSALEDRFKAWHRSREAEARGEFEQMLGENSFVEFWGRMRKKKLDEAALKVEADEMEEGEGLGDGGAADLTALAKQIDLDEIKAVLRRDGRYRQFDHAPELREQWLREYLERQEAHSGSSTIHHVGEADR